MTEQEAIDFAKAKHPECTYAHTDYGLGPLFQPTWVVKLWRHEALYLEGDPPRHTLESIPRDTPSRR